MAVQKPRQIALNILRRHAERVRFLDAIVTDELDAARLTPPDRRLVQELTYGAVRQQAILDWLIQKKAQKVMPKGVLRVILRLGLYQIFFLDRIPDHAVVNESVELVHQFGNDAQAGFVNALLRGYLRDREAVAGELRELKSSRPALGYSHPEWLWHRWANRMSAENLVTLMEWNNSPAVTYVRVNTLKATPEALTTRWKQENVDYKAKSFDWAPEGWVYEIRPPGGLSQLSSFREGMFYVQDPSTLLAVDVLDPKPGESILDFCAAPGGKTTYMAQRMNNEGYIMAQDLDIHRRNAIKQNCLRLGVRTVSISRATSSINFDLSEPFDKVLLDVPCSNTGVMRRRVDLRWRLSQEDLYRLRATQLNLLVRAMPQVKVGGAIIYSTCSLEPEENTEVIEEFLLHDKNFRLESERMLTPWENGVDGAYVVKMTRTE